MEFLPRCYQLAPPNLPCSSPQAAQACDSSAGSGGARKQGLALSLARGWRKLVGEATDEVRWLPTGCLQLLDTLQQARGSCFWCLCSCIRPACAN